AKSSTRSQFSNSQQPTNPQTKPPHSHKGGGFVISSESPLILPEHFQKINQSDGLGIFFHRKALNAGIHNILFCCVYILSRVVESGFYFGRGSALYFDGPDVTWLF